MNRQEYTNSIQKVMGMIASDHQADASEVLTALSEAFETAMNDLDAANENVTTLTEMKEKLRRVNTELFLKVGSKPTSETDKGHGTEQTDIPELKYDDLFNEKGELK